LENLLLNALLAGIVEVTEVGGGEVPALRRIMLTCLLLVTDPFNGLLSVLMDA
jgi:hypothetical protein